jgi:phage terminase Nu1 subunit (DNA packaging protein)
MGVQTTDSRPAPMTLTAYAKRRGVSTMAVSRAIARKRLVQSVVRNERGVPAIADPDLADREWDANTDLTHAPTYVKERAAARAAGAPPPDDDDAEDEAPDLSSVEDMSLADASRSEKAWKAKLAELKYRQAAGELVPAKDVSRALEDTFARCKTKLLAVHSRARQSLPHLTVADLAVIEDLIREALEDLAGGAT